MIATLILNILTAKVLPVILPPIIAAARKFVLAKVPPQLLPLLLSVGGALVDTAATALGVEGVPADLPMLGAAAWEGALIGLAATGVHQAWKQGKEWLRAHRS